MFHRLRLYGVFSLLTLFLHIEYGHIPNHNILTFGVRKENVLYMVPQCKDEIGHGTAVCGIILSKSPEAQVCVIKIFDTNFCVDPEWIYKNY